MITKGVDFNITRSSALLNKSGDQKLITACTETLEVN